MQTGCSSDKRIMEAKKEAEIRRHTKDTYIGAGKFENKHVPIATSITTNTQRVWLMNVYFLHSVYADHHIEKTYNSIEKLMKSKRNIQIVGGAFNAELGPGIGLERVSVGQKYPQTVEQEKRLDEAAVDVAEIRYAVHNVQKDARKTSYIQDTERCREAVGIHLGKRNYLGRSRDAESNDMIHMECDHRSVMAQFVIPAPKKKNSPKGYTKWRENPNNGEHQRPSQWRSEVRNS